MYHSPYPHSPLGIIGAQACLVETSVLALVK